MRDSTVEKKQYFKRILRRIYNNIHENVYMYIYRKKFLKLISNYFIYFKIVYLFTKKKKLLKYFMLIRNLLVI